MANKPASPFDWLVRLLCWCYAHSDFAGDFPTLDAYLADLYLLEYHSGYLGAVAVYRTHHYGNEYYSPDWETIGHKMGDGCKKEGYDDGN